MVITREKCSYEGMKRVVGVGQCEVGEAWTATRHKTLNKLILLSVLLNRYNRSSLSLGCFHFVGNLACKVVLLILILHLIQINNTKLHTNECTQLVTYPGKYVYYSNLTNEVRKSSIILELGRNPCYAGIMHNTVHRINNHTHNMPSGQRNYPCRPIWQ